MDLSNDFMKALVRQHQERQADKRKRTTRISLTCFDGSYEFQLLYAGILEVETKAGVGFGAVYGQIVRGIYHTGEDAISLPTEGTFTPAVLLEVIRQGLIGGNKCTVDGIEAQVSPARANSLIERYLSPLNGGTIKEAWNLAAAIVHAAFEGVIVEDKVPTQAPETDDGELESVDLPEAAE